MEDLRKRIGARLKEKRDALGLKQSDVAIRMGSTPLTVHRVETGQFEAKIGTVVAYCRAVGMKLDDILADEPIKEVTPTFSNADIISAVTNALKIAENPLILRILKCSDEEMLALETRLDMIERARKRSIDKVSDFSKKAK